MQFTRNPASLKQAWLAVAVVAGTGSVGVVTAPAASAAEATLPMTLCEALMNLDLTPLDARITDRREGHAQRSRLLRRQGNYQPGHPVLRRCCPRRPGGVTICSRAAEGSAAKPT